MLKLDDLVNPSSLSETFTCPLCLDLLQEPVFAGGKPCQHVFCNACISEALKVTPQCPSCKAKLTMQMLQPHQFVRNLLDEAVVKCPNLCGWTGRFDHRSWHLEDCHVTKLKEAVEAARRDLEANEAEWDQSAAKNASLQCQLAAADEACHANRESHVQLESKLAKCEQELAVALEETLPLEGAPDDLEDGIQELRQHAAAIFRHFLTLANGWERKKSITERAGDASDENGRKQMRDASLLGIEPFIYRINREQDVRTYLVTKSIDEQRKQRAWADEDESRILAFLATKLRSHIGSSTMLRGICGSAIVKHALLVRLDEAALEARYQTCLIHAQLVDEALGELQKDPSLLLRCVGKLAFVWSNWRLDQEDKFRQNEVLLLLSTLIFGAVQAILGRPEYFSDFAQACSYFMLLLYAVEWPIQWKRSLIEKLQALGTPTPKGHRIQHEMNLELREQIGLHIVTQEAQSTESQIQKLPPGGEFYGRHRYLYSWAMNTENLARGYVEATIRKVDAENWEFYS